MQLCLLFLDREVPWDCRVGTKRDKYEVSIENVQVSYKTVSKYYHLRVCLPAKYKAFDILDRRFIPHAMLSKIEVFTCFAIDRGTRR